MKSNKTNGFFITFEGIDGSGKSLQSQMLAEALQSREYTVEQIRDPGGPEISEQIRGILLNRDNHKMAPVTELLLYQAARAQLVSEKILPALKQGHIVISDRFFDSTVAYQGYGRNLDLDMINRANRLGSLDVTPNRTYYLDIEYKESLRRRTADGKTADRMENNGEAFFQTIRSGYIKTAEQQSQRILQLDGSLSVQTLSRQILEDLLPRLPKPQEMG